MKSQIFKSLKESVNKKRYFISLSMAFFSFLFALAAIILFLCGTSEHMTAASTDLETRSFHVDMNVYGSSDIKTHCVQMHESETILLNADNGADYYQWQAFVPQKNTWADIYNDNKPQCRLYYAKLCNMLDENDSVTFRLITENNNVNYESERFNVTINDTRTAQNVSTPSISSIYTQNTSVKSPKRRSPNSDVYSITVNFLYEDGSEAFQNLYANYSASQSINREITLETLNGYTPVIRSSTPMVCTGFCSLLEHRSHIHLSNLL